MGLVAKFKKLGPKIFMKKVLGYEPVFACAIRKKGDRTLYEGNTEQAFSLVPIDKDCWYADPLFYEYDNRTFLFMESWGYRSRKGVIVCSEVFDDKVLNAKTVLEEDFHISFPNIFEFKGEIYMLPEIEESGGINLYKCVEFPYKWKKVTHIDTKYPLIDIIIESIEDDTLYLNGSSFDESNDLQTCFYRFKLKINSEDSIEFIDETNMMTEMSYENRNAGRLVILNDKEGIHCVQRSTKSIYGYSMKFFNTNYMNHRWIDSKDKALEILPKDIMIKGFSKEIIGTHTYSETDKYEVVDVSYFRWSPMNWVRQIIK